MARPLLFVSLALLLACGASPEDRLEAARAALAKGAYADAAATAGEGLAAGASGATAWRLELAALEGEARGKDGAAARARIERLAGEKPDQVKGPLYVQTAGQLREAGDAAGAVELLDAGLKRFPGDADLAKAIDAAKASGNDAERARLCSLGYLACDDAKPASGAAAPSGAQAPPAAAEPPKP
jgi:hypothetical protein